MKWNFWRRETSRRYESKRTCQHLKHRDEWSLYTGFTRGLCVYCGNCDSFFGDMTAHENQAKDYRQVSIERQHEADRIVKATLAVHEKP